MAMVSLSFCQNGYPKAITDSTVAITIQQVRTINRIKIEHGKYRTLSDSLQLDRERYKNLTLELDSLTTVQSNTIDMQGYVISNSQVIQLRLETSLKYQKRLKVGAFVLTGIMVAVLIVK